MIKAVIIDDEPDARFILKNLLHTNFGEDIVVIAEADDVKSGVDTILSNNPDVIFLDIRMRGETGFDILEQIKEKKIEIVFVTAFDQYAIKAFQFSAIGYLMKPIRIKELKQVIASIKEKSEKNKESSTSRLKVLIENYGDDRKIHKLVISNMEGFKVISIEEIIRLEGDRNYTDFILIDGKKVTATKTLGEYQELLNDFGFFRVHQSTIVNLRHVKGYQRNERLIEMVDGAKIVMSRHRKNDFIEKFL